MLMVMTLSLMVACSNDDENDSDDTALKASYQKTKNGIIGTWVMDGYHDLSRSSNPYINLGWNDPWPYQNFEQFKYTFSTQGNLTDNRGGIYGYSIVMDETTKVYYGKDNDNFYWPFSKGSVVLTIQNKYITKYYVEIKNDGMLYLYNYEASTGGSGVPKYRYKKQ